MTPLVYPDEYAPCALDPTPSPLPVTVTTVTTPSSCSRCDWPVDEDGFCSFCAKVNS